VDVTTARVFSDPPMNFLNIRKAGTHIHFGDGQAATATGSLASLSDGDYIAGFRPNHLELERHADGAWDFRPG
jgi:glycerol transport system ATP-binding protein